MSLGELTSLVNKIGKRVYPNFKGYSMRLPESLQQLNNLPLGKITEVNETNSMRASNTLLISIRTFQVQLYVSLDDDLELLDDALKRGLEPYGYYSGYCEGYPHPDWKTVYVKTIQYKKTKYY